MSSRLFDHRVHQYGDPQGELLLRERVADYVNRSRGCHCNADQIAIVNGSQQALDIIARMFISPGDSVIVEEPGYQAAKAVFQTVGATLLPNAVDTDGMQTEPLAKRKSKARLIYVTPLASVPYRIHSLTVTMPGPAGVG